MHLTISIALLGGLLSFFSPCIFPLLPTYIAVLTGGSISDGKVNTTKRLIVIRSIAFAIGFSLIFTILGASASLLGHWLLFYRPVLEKIGGFLIILFGFQMAGFIRLTFLFKEKRFSRNPSRSMNVLNAVVMGMFFAIGWSPCVGLTLASILILASSSETIRDGSAMLFIYSVGLAIPFILIGVTMTFSLNVIKKMNKWLPFLSQLSGWLLIIFGLLMFTNMIDKINGWLIG